MTTQTRSYSFDQPLDFELSRAVFKADPFPTLAAVREAGPVVPLKVPFVGKTWFATTHAAVTAMMKDNTLFVMEGRHAGKAGFAGQQWWMPASLRMLANNMLLKDEPDHRRLRKLVDQAFGRRGILEMRSRIEQVADRILDTFEGRAEVDLANEYSRQLPLDVICDLLGLPEQDRKVFADWARALTSMTGVFSLVGGMGAIRRMTAYVREQIEIVRREPRPGLIAELVRAEADGDKLDADELVSMVLLLLVAGSETTTHLVTGAVVELERTPEQKAFLLADPAGRMERAVEELARHVSPVQMSKPRFVARDVEFFGQTLHQGEIIMALFSSANADPEVFDAPGQLRLDRFPNPHLVFSTGIHFCLGMQLARVEAQSALARLYARFPHLALATDRFDYIERLGVRGFKSLPVKLNGQARAIAA